MNKVYFDLEKKFWFVNEPEDMYFFKSVNFETNEEQNQILTWTRGFCMDDYPNHIRMYDVEINNVKYFFLMKREGENFTLESEDPSQLENLINLENMFFTGETYLNS